MKKQQPLATQCQTGVVSVSQKTTTSNIVTINNSYNHAKSHPIKYTDPDGKKVINHSSNWALVRMGNGKTEAIAPGGIITESIDGIMTYDGNNFKVSDFGSKGTFEIQDSTDENGVTTPKVAPSKMTAFGIWARNLAQKFFNLFRPDGAKKDLEGPHQKGDGSKSNEQWLNKATADVNEILGTEGPVFDSTPENWNEKIKAYDDKMKEVPSAE
ncbi:hypothetical protein FACS1894130_12190 [Spirochaetia bacterium]|nr:hypothetical protein FACS1894130_12190 [Spirochaetia bacterium]